MRPVDRGPKPSDITLNHYSDAAEALRTAIGAYCSYCEKPLTDVTDVEHVRPKKHFPEQILDWNNFLLACSTCNRIKGAKPQDDLSGYVFPDSENPLCFLQYAPLSTPKVRFNVEDLERRRMQRTLDLVGLERDSHSVVKASVKDRRWKQRNSVWEKAFEIQQMISDSPDLVSSKDFPRLFSIIVHDSGFFSVWMEAFAGSEVLMKLILNALPGTARSAFDESCRPIIRSLG